MTARPTSMSKNKYDVTEVLFTATTIATDCYKL